MSIRIDDNGSTITVKLEGELDHHVAKSLREKIDNYINIYMPKKVILDFKDLDFMDSSGIGFIMGRYKLLSEIKSKLYIINMSEDFKKVMKLAGLEKLNINLEKGSEEDENNQ